jgi:hypothetical protein
LRLSLELGCHVWAMVAHRVIKEFEAWEAWYDAGRRCGETS